jgi:hypothetical protein
MPAVDPAVARAMLARVTEVTGRSWASAAKLPRFAPVLEPPATL